MGTRIGIEIGLGIGCILPRRSQISGLASTACWETRGRVGRRRRLLRKEVCRSCTEKMEQEEKRRLREQMEKVGRKSIDDRVLKCGGGGRESKEMKMISDMKSVDRLQ